MLAKLIICIRCAVVIFLLVVVHEFGHYAAGLLVGVPAQSMRIRIFTYPPHVELKDADTWVVPWNHRYGTIAQRHIKSRRNAILVISAGLLLQTFVFAGFVAILVRMGKPRSYLLPITISVLAWPIWYLCLDWTLTHRSGFPAGDYSSLWMISPLASVLVTVFVISSHIALVVYVNQRE
ncbi:MAG: site-2 protease family protein [Chthoniobacteraceae bacterium]